MNISGKDEAIMVNRTSVETDVLVLGAGPSGFAAAYTEAKNGAKVILAEQCGEVGGISTSGLMSHCTGNCGSRCFGSFRHKITRS